MAAQQNAKLPTPSNPLSVSLRALSEEALQQVIFFSQYVGQIHNGRAILVEAQTEAQEEGRQLMEALRRELDHFDAASASERATTDELLVLHKMRLYTLEFLQVYGQVKLEHIKKSISVIDGYLALIQAILFTE